MSSSSAVPQHRIRPTQEEIDQELKRLDDLVVKGKEAEKNTEVLRAVVDAATARAKSEHEAAVSALQKKYDTSKASERLAKIKEEMASPKADKKALGIEKANLAQEVQAAAEALQKEKAPLDDALEAALQKISEFPEQKMLDAMRQLPLLSSKLEVLQASYPCPLKAVPHGGPCPICKKSHEVKRDDKAIEAAKRLWNTVKKNPQAAGLSPDEASDLERQGSMLGVLQCTDADGKPVELRAFSKNMEVDPFAQVANPFWCVTAPATTLHGPGGKKKVDEAANDPPKLDSVVGQCAAPRMLSYVANYPQSAHEALDQAYADAAGQALDNLGLPSDLPKDPGARAAALQQASDQLQAKVEKAKSELAENLTTKGDKHGYYVARAKVPNTGKDDASRREIREALDKMGPSVLKLPGLQDKLENLQRILDAEPKGSAPREEKNRWSTQVASAFDELVKQIDPALKAEQKRLLDLPGQYEASKAKLPKGPLKIDSMAEIWVGKGLETSWPQKVDGDLYDSCLTCHGTLGYTLCDHKH